MIPLYTRDYFLSTYVFKNFFFVHNYSYKMYEYIYNIFKNVLLWALVNIFFFAIVIK